MSGLTASWVLGHSESKGVLRMVLYVLAHNADDAGEGGMRLGVVAHQAALEDRDQAEQAVQLLAQAGHIELVDRGRPKTVHYTLVYPGNDPEWLEAHCGSAPSREEVEVG